MQLSVLADLGTYGARLAPMRDSALLERDLGDVAHAWALADQSYGSWLADLQATGCYGAPTNDAHYVAAGRESAAAAPAKAQLAATWARVAPSYPVWAP
jgi:hypothetical protein